MRRSTRIVLVLAIVAAGCSDSTLAGLGDRSSEWVAAESEESIATAPILSTRSTDLISAADIHWWNDELARSVDESVSLESISARRNPGDRFAQASRREIASFFPELEFPARVPADVQAVTSQLVLEPSEPALGTDHIASFGLWTSDPYTRSRSVGQLAIITVFAGGTEDPCGGAGDQCRTERVGDRTVGRVVRSSGETILWSDADLTYEMFVRERAMASVPAMLESVAPISILAGEVATAPTEAAGVASPPATVP